MVDLDKAKQYLRVDFNLDDVEIEMLIQSSYAYLEGATGVDYSMQNNKKADLFILALVSECYNDRGLTDKEKTVAAGANKMKYIYKSILLQLQLEAEDYV